MIQPFLIIAETPGRGRGIFTSDDISADTVIEIAPVIVMSREDRVLLDQTLLHDYIFEWGEQKDKCAMALGYVPLYNHANNSNCEYGMNYEDETITITTKRNIAAGEELFINYNGDWDDKREVWFEVV